MKQIKKAFLLLFIPFALLNILSASPININQADRAEIVENLMGIGNVKADAIIEYRDEHGPFETVSDLLKVKGIGAKTVEQIEDDLLKDPKDETKLAQ